MDDYKAVLKKLARMAINVQDACNLSGVVHSWSELCLELRQAVEKECADKGTPFSTDVLNSHPVNVLYSNKVAQLTGSENDGSFSSAYNWAMDLTGS